MSSGSFQLMVLLGREAEGFVPIGGTVSLLFSDVIEELRKIARVVPLTVKQRLDTIPPILRTKAKEGGFARPRFPWLRFFKPFRSELCFRHTSNIPTNNKVL